ncbi:MAG: GNAT family N-acetyltransferase, partial [Chloroflexota bacterium]
MQFEHIYIETERVFLRPVAAKDSKPFYHVYADPEAMKYWSSLPFERESQAQEKIVGAIDAFDSGKALLLAIVLKETNEFIGTMSLFSIHVESRRAEVGYMLSRSFWRKGLMTEALGAFIHYCFYELNLNRLEADIDPANRASAALLTKCVGETATDTFTYTISDGNGGTDTAQLT